MGESSTDYVASMVRRLPKLATALRAAIPPGDQERGSLVSEAYQAMTRLVAALVDTEALPAEDVCELPVELLFTEGSNREPILNWTPEWQRLHDVWADLPLARLRPHLELFEFLSGRGARPQAYLDWYEKIHRSRGLEPPLSAEQLLSRRFTEFRKMERAITSWESFFHQFPVTVSFNPRGYFNIADGHHRAAFLFARGWRTVPCRLPRHQLGAWKNPQLREELQAELFSSGEQRLLYTPVLLDGFRQLESERDGLAPSRLDVILRYLGPRRLRGVRVLDIGCNIGFYARHFVREGAEVTGVEPDAAHARLARLLNASWGVSFDLLEEPFQDASLEPHAVGLALTVLYHFGADRALRDKFLRNLDRSVTDMLFWESGPHPEQEKEWILSSTHFSTYERLAQTYGTGKVRELGVFTRG